MRAILILLFLFICSEAFSATYKPTSRRFNSVTTTNVFFHTELSGNQYVYTVTAFNHHTADLYLHIFDTNNVPAAGWRPVLPALRIPANSTGGYEFEHACDFTVGIAVGASTTPVTFTNASTVFDIAITARK